MVYISYKMAQKLINELQCHENEKKGRREEKDERNRRM